MPAAGTRLTPIALVVLSLLHEEPMHPYEMHQTLRIRHTDRVVKLKAGTLYHTVERLARQGLIAPTETSRTGRRPERTVYTITDVGRDLFTEQTLTMLSSPADEFPEYPLALTLANDVPVETVIIELERRCGELRRANELDDLSVGRLERMDLPRAYWLDVVYQQAMRKAELAWTEALLDDLRSERLTWPNDPIDKTSVK
ncbi:PadR family transcriptional regulator [Flindersiella endophytica]